MWLLIVLGLIGLAYSFFGFRKIQQETRAVVEFFGKFSRVLKPGLNWILPGMEKIRATPPTWELSIPLFEEETKIDFKDGAAIPKNAKVFVKMESPDKPYEAGGEKEKKSGAFRAIYEVNNWRIAIKDLIENEARVFLNGLSVDDAIVKNKIGFDILGEGLNGLPDEEIKKIKNTLSFWGFELKRITIGDFELDSEIVESRNKIQVRKKELKAAEYVKKIRAEETMGFLMKMIALYRSKKLQDVKKEIEANEEIKKNLWLFSQELVLRRMSLDRDALRDIKIGGGGSSDIESAILKLIGLVKGLEGRKDSGKRDETDNG